MFVILLGSSFELKANMLQSGWLKQGLLAQLASFLITNCDSQFASSLVRLAKSYFRESVRLESKHSEEKRKTKKRNFIKF